MDTGELRFVEHLIPQVSDTLRDLDTGFGLTPWIEQHCAAAPIIIAFVKHSVDTREIFVFRIYGDRGEAWQI